MKRVERWLDSGLTAREFAAEIGVKPSTLASWRWRLRHEGVSGRPGAVDGGTAAPPFVELIAATALVEAPTPAPADEESEALELLLAGGHRLRIPVRFDPGSLRRVLATLEAR